MPDGIFWREMIPREASTPELQEAGKNGSWKLTVRAVTRLTKEPQSFTWISAKSCYPTANLVSMQVCYHASVEIGILLMSMVSKHYFIKVRYFDRFRAIFLLQRFAISLPQDTSTKATRKKKTHTQKKTETILTLITLIMSLPGSQDKPRELSHEYC